MVTEEKKQNHAFFTVDFECFTHDLCRSLGSKTKPRLRSGQLLRSVYNLQKILSSTSHQSTRLTFFCTGISAELYPEILKEIAALGHEIACHGNFHDDVNKTRPDILYTELKLAQEKISNVTGKEVAGFRAPRFSLDKFDFERLDVISKIFRYDSSLHFSDEAEFALWKSQCPVNIVEYPVPRQQVCVPRFKAKLGGSYLKLFPASIVRNAATQSINNGLTPIFYFHPYDLFYDHGLLASWGELRGAKLRLYWYIRQIQWASLFNWSQESKLYHIFRLFNNQGTLQEYMRSMQSAENNSTFVDDIGKTNSFEKKNS